MAESGKAEAGRKKKDGKARPPAPAGIDFLASHGGPFFDLQAQLSLLKQNSLQVGRSAVLFVAIAWAVPFFLGLPDSLSLAPVGGTYLTDLTVWARFFIAIAAFVLAEQQVERGLHVKLDQFMQAPLIAPEAMPAAMRAVAAALRQRDWRNAELVCLLIAALVAVLSYVNLHKSHVASWAVRTGPDGDRLTLAGWWTVLVSYPLFVFLFLRGLWRHFVWTRLMRTIASLDLRLVASHPDGKGGLAFLAEYPNAYMLFVFGISSVVAAALAKHSLRESLSLSTFTLVVSGWLVIVLALFAYPLSAFSVPLMRMKQAGLLLLSTQATRYHRAAERKLLGRNVIAEDPAEAGEEVADPSKQFDVTRKLSTMLISRAAIVPVAGAALLPFVVVGATRLPFKEVWSVVKKLLLL